MANQAQYLRARHNGICVHCYVAKAIPGRVLCEPCRDRASRHQRSRTRAWHSWLDSVVVSRGCAKCGWRQAASGLCFHHLDPSQKKFGIADGYYSHTTHEIAEEVEKCVVLCLNCHGQYHAHVLNIDGVSTVKLSGGEKIGLIEARRKADKRLKDERNWEEITTGENSQKLRESSASLAGVPSEWERLLDEGGFWDGEAGDGVGGGAGKTA